MPLHIVLDSKDRIANDSLSDFYRLIAPFKKASGCELSEATLARQFLDLASQELKRSDVFEASLGKETIYFTRSGGRAFRTVEAIIAGCGSLEPVK